MPDAVVTSGRLLIWVSVVCLGFWSVASKLFRTAASEYVYAACSLHCTHCLFPEALVECCCPQLGEMSFTDHTTWTGTAFITPPGTAYFSPNTAVCPSLFLITTAILSDGFWLPISWFVFCRAFNRDYFLIVNAQIGPERPVCSIVFCNFPKIYTAIAELFCGA